VWLKDYWLACHAGRLTKDLFIIKNLLLNLSNSVQTWLEHLLRGEISD
jgi:hypothetical protein